MDQQFESLQRSAESTIQEWTKQGFDRDMRVATWVLVGNGASLLLCFNAVIGGDVRDWSAIKPFAMAFLLGIFCAFASVLFDGELVRRATARLMHMSGASKQVAICLQANVEFRAHLAKNPGSHPIIEAQISDNDGVIARARDDLRKYGAAPSHEEWLHRGVKITLAIGAASLGVALFFAVYGRSMEALVHK